jgi:hypothetical protein
VRWLREMSYWLLFIAAILMPPCLSGQSPQLRTKSGKRFPTVVFTSVFWAADPSYYSIALDSTGTATYLSAPSSLDKTGVPYTVEFLASDRTRRIAFNVVQRFDFLAENSGAAPSPDKTSVRTLIYTDGSFKNQFTYGTPSTPDLEELTSVFEEVSATFESGRRLAYFQLNDRKAVEAELHELSNRAERHKARELQALIPILRRLASDQHLASAARSQAETLFELAQHWH